MTASRKQLSAAGHRRARKVYVSPGCDGHHH
uniref:Uncharacterized protein n=1 Tax=Anguilla anguilla TaxID=7936 RepID=A0A0E9VE90_ANGAN